MKYKLYFPALALILLVMAGCGNRNTATTNGDAHDHANCSGDHSHDHSTPAKYARDHEHGAACASAGHSHASGASHDGHDHGKGAATHEHSGDCSHGAAVDMEDAIFFPPAQASLTDFEVEVINPGTFAQLLKTSGRVMPAPGQQVSVPATVSGVVSLTARAAQEGVRVASGTTLFHVSSSNLAEGDIFIRTEAQYRKALSDYQRAEALLADNIISQREFDEISLALQQAETQYNAISGSRSDKGAAIGSPIGGYVASVLVKDGDYVEVGQSLAVITQNQKLTLRAEVSQKYFGILSGVRDANFVVPYSGHAFTVSELGGRMVSVGSGAAEGQTLIPVTFEFPNNGEVFPGTYVEVYLKGAELSNVLAVPVTAVTEQQGLFYVYQQLDPEHYLRREVQLAGSDGMRVQVTGGLQGGERIVTRGAVNIKMASASGEIPHGHEH